MDLESLIAEAFTNLIEGGAAIESQPVPQNRVKPTIDAFINTVLSGLEHRSVKPVGSTGKKSVSGDLDLGLDTDLSIDQVAQHLTKLGLVFKVNKGLGEIHVQFSQHDVDGTKLDDPAQIDLMIGPESWTQWQYYGPSDTESKYKGVHVRGITNAIFKVAGKHSVSPSRGVFSIDDPEKKYSRNITSVLDRVNDNSIGDEPWVASDFQKPFEQIWAKAQESFTPEDLVKIKAYFLDFMKSTKQTPPTEMGEGMAYDKVQPFYGLPKGAQKGHGNVGGARNRGTPGYPVPPEMSTKRGAGNPDLDDEGFAVLEAVESSEWSRLQSWILKNTPVKKIVPIKNDAFNGTGGLAMYKPSLRTINVSLDAKDPDRLYAVAHEAGHSLDLNTREREQDALNLAGLKKFTQWQAKQYLDMEQAAWDRGEDVLRGAGIEPGQTWRARMVKSMTYNRKDVARDTINEAKDPGELQKGIQHIDDLKPEQFLAFLKKYADEPLRLEISEKVDGSARVSFGKGSGHIWTQSKNGTRKAMSNQYPDTPMYKALKMAHKALESKAPAIMAHWPAGVSFMVAEVLYTRIPNSIEYGPNVLMIHGVHTDEAPLGDLEAKKAATAVIKAAGGELSDGSEGWKFEYKRTVDPQDFSVDVRKEFDTLGDLYKDLQDKPMRSAGYKDVQARFKGIQKQVKDKLIKQLRTQKSAYGPVGGDVEGLVFRDLDSGAMVKLVDKDFFTELNNFLWHHRKMLDMGAKVGGEWKTGLMQGFHKVVADQIIGDSTAASTMLVKNLVPYAEGEGGDEPVEKADRAIAAYIRNKGLMSSPEFARDFQRSLMGAFKDLANMKAGWEEFKSKPQSVQIGGKTRQFPPEHVERTELAFNEAEAALAGIKAGLDVATKITHPMTQKVALFKLFMGHKFDKLVAALSGVKDEPEEVSEANNWLKAVAAATLMGVASPSAVDATRPTKQEPTPVAQQIDAPKKTVEDFIKMAAQESQIPVELIRAIISVESNGKAGATNPSGARGLMQLMPATAKSVGVEDPHDPEQSIRGGARYLKHLLKIFKGSLTHAIAAYNAGPTWIARNGLDRLPAETASYVGKVKSKMGIKEGIFSRLRPDYEQPEETGGTTAAKLLNTFRDKLTKHGINPKKLLGYGAYGNAYDLGNDKVLKITSDEAEARASFHLMNKHLNHVVRYERVFRFPKLEMAQGYDEDYYDENGNKPYKNNHYGIVMEKVQPGTDNPYQFTSSIREFMAAVSKDNWFNKQMRWPELSAYFMQLYSTNSETASDILEVLDSHQIGEIRDELLANNIEFSDFHSDNMGRRKDGTWVVFDLGSDSMSPVSANAIPVVEGSPINRATGPTALDGTKMNEPDLEDAKNINMLESMIAEQLSRLLESSGQSSVGVTIGRFQPFHAGHAAIIRELAKKFTNVVVFVAGQKIDAKNPFTHDLRLKMMEMSLPDVWSKVKVFPATIQGKGTGYVPGLIANASASGAAAISGDDVVNVLVGEDRVEDQKKQAINNNSHKGEAGYYNGIINVSALPGVKNDDDAGRISGTRVREALSKNDRTAVSQMMDPHLAQNPEFASVYEDMRKQLSKFGLANEIVEAVIAELGMGGAEGGPGATRGGGSSGWSRAVLAKDMTGDEMFNQMLRSPSTRMLPMAHHGVPNSNLPGIDVLNQEDDTERDISKPTDLGEVIQQALTQLLEASPADREAAKQAKIAAREKAAADKVAAKAAAREKAAADKVAAKAAASLAKVEASRTALSNVELAPWHKRNTVEWKTTDVKRQMALGDISDPLHADEERDVKIQGTVPKDTKDTTPKWVSYDRGGFDSGIGEGVLHEDSKGTSDFSTGNGEFKFAWEMCRLKKVPFSLSLKATGENGDISVAGSNYEIKELHFNKNLRSQSDRLTTSIEKSQAAISFRDNIKTLANELRKWEYEANTEEIKNSLRAFNNVVRQKYTNSESLSRGIVSRPQIQEIFKMCQLLNKIHEDPAMDAEYDFTAGPRKGKIKASQLRQHAMLSWIQDPSTFLHDWLNLGLSLSDFFPNNAGTIVIVDEEKGYFMFPREEASKYFEINTFDGSRNTISISPKGVGGQQQTG